MMDNKGSNQILAVIDGAWLANPSTSQAPCRLVCGIFHSDGSIPAPPKLDIYLYNRRRQTANLFFAISPEYTPFHFRDKGYDLWYGFLMRSFGCNPGT
jgi:hypothetical protein